VHIHASGLAKGEKGTTSVGTTRPGQLFSAATVYHNPGGSCIPQEACVRYLENVDSPQIPKGCLSVGDQAWIIEFCVTKRKSQENEAVEI
jgi:hypothetical protein